MDQEWRALSPEDQQRVRDKREDRDKRRGLQVMQRNVRPRIEDDTESMPMLQPPWEHGIGAVMSQCQNNLWGSA
jgi:hypothetical protein